MSSSYNKHDTGIYEYRDRNRKRPFIWRQMVQGKQVSESFDTLAKAKAAKKSHEAYLKKYGKISTDFNEKDWAELKAAREVLPSGVSVLDAANEYLARHGVGKNRALDDCVRLYFDFQKSRNNSRRYVQTVESTLNKLLEYLGKPLIREVSRSDVMEALSKLSQLVSVRTVKNHRAIWSQFFGYLVDVEELAESPMANITLNHLPKEKGGSRKNPLELDKVIWIMALAERDFPELAYWLALQFFVGIRSDEANRFQHEWVQPKFNRIMIPGWFYENGEAKGGTKTRDDWMIDKVPENFWSWHSKYGKVSGKVECPGNNYQWDRRVRKPVIEEGVVKKWPHNTKRDSFCTYHLSAYRDQAQTALILKHTNVTTLWKSYMGTLRTEQEGRAYFQIYPRSSLLRGIGRTG